MKGLNGGNGSESQFQPNTAWNFGPIYTSTLNHRLIMLRFPHLEPFMKPIVPQEWVHICDLPPQMCPADTKDFKVKIRLIPANHCPGSTLIHISGPLGEVLHTGDFRFNGAPMLS